jgi:hypothetical protein
MSCNWKVNTFDCGTLRLVTDFRVGWRAGWPGCSLPGATFERVSLNPEMRGLLGGE